MQKVAQNQATSKPHGGHLVSHAAIYLVARGLPGIVGFLAIPVFTRLLEPGDYGRFALVVSTGTVLNALVFQWVRMSLVRYLPAYQADPAKLKSTLVAANALVAMIIAAIGGVLFLIPAAHAWRGMIWPCWGVTIAQAAFELCSEYSRATLRPWRYMVLQSIRSLLSLALGAAMVLAGLKWLGPLLGTTIGMTIPALLVIRHDWSDVRLKIDRQILHRVAQYGIPLSLTVALTFVISTSDRYLIAGFLGDDAAGLYSVAVDFTSQTLTMLLMVVYMAAFPLAVRAWEHHGREAATGQMRTNASLLMAIGIPCTIGLSVLAPNLAHCLLGAKYRVTAAAIMPWVAVGSLLAGLKAYHFDSAFQFAHRTIYQVWIVLFAALLNVGLNVAMIPLMGINGAAIASVIAFIVSIVMTASLGRRHFAVPFPPAILARVLAAGAAMGAALWPMRASRGPVSLGIEIALGMGVYAAMLLAMNFMHLRDHLVRRISNIMGKRAAVGAAEVAA